MKGSGVLRNWGQTKLKGELVNGEQYSRFFLIPLSLVFSLEITSLELAIHGGSIGW